MSFQKTVLTVAIVLFIILMLLIAVMMSSAKKNEKFPNLLKIGISSYVT